MSCFKCGLCCKTYPIDVTFEDRDRWKKEERDDILKQLVYMADKGYYFKVRPCTFLTEKNECSIYETRPQSCKSFPVGHIDEDCWCPDFILMRQYGNCSNKL